MSNSPGEPRQCVGSYFDTVPEGDSVFGGRNNLTVFDMVMVRGHGARELLRIGGKLPGPGASLRFNVPQATLMECRDSKPPACVLY